MSASGRPSQLRAQPEERARNSMYVTLLKVLVALVPRCMLFSVVGPRLVGQASLAWSCLAQVR